MTVPINPMLDYKFAPFSSGWHYPQKHGLRWRRSLLLATIGLQLVNISTVLRHRSFSQCLLWLEPHVWRQAGGSFSPGPRLKRGHLLVRHVDLNGLRAENSPLNRRHWHTCLP
jgi:hypothetical protein